MSARAKRRTAIHEAGHCALLIALFGAGGCRGATIVPDYKAGTSGHAINPGQGRAAQTFGEKDDYVAQLHMLAREAFCLRRAIMYFAGAEAVRQLTRARDAEAGADDDRLNAASDLETLTTDVETLDLLVALAKRRCALLVEHYRPEIEAIAKVLLAKRTLNGRAIHKIFVTSLTKRRGMLVTF
jgi:ATP-dependent Zn protease